LRGYFTGVFPCICSADHAPGSKRFVSLKKNAYGVD